jgi:hypothetical protein
MYRTVEYDTTKDGAPPQIVKPADTGAFQFLGGNLFLHGPKINANGLTKTWEVEGSYTFAVAGLPSLALDTGLVMTSLPLPTTTQQYLTLTYGSGQQIPDNVLSQAGADVRACYAEAQGVSFVGPSYTYWGTTLFPGQFFNAQMLNGNTNFVVSQ